MSDWGAAERAEGQRQDVRHTKWLARLFGRRSERPGGRIPTAGHGWAETVAAYRWLDTPDVGIQAMLSGQAPATLERIRAQAAVWLVQDTTCLTYGTTPPKAAMGPVKRNTREEYGLHSTGALTPERVHVGVVGRKGWQRPEEPLAQQRTSAPAGSQGLKAPARSHRPVRPLWWGPWPSATGSSRSGVWTRGAGSHTTGQRGSSAPRVIDALGREPRRGLDGPRCSRQPPWGHAPSPAPARLSGHPDRAPSREQPRQ
jgi:hypothetical protein